MQKVERAVVFRLAHSRQRDNTRFCFTSARYRLPAPSASQPARCSSISSALTW